MKVTKFIGLFCPLALTLLLSSCSSHHSNLTMQNTQHHEPTPRIKNLIMMIGDGMGPQQIGLLETYATRAPQSIYQGQTTGLKTFANQGVIGLSDTGPKNNLVVDSACSATHLATGVFSASEMIGLDVNGNSVPTILEKAKAMGKATGLVSDTRLTHATPAAFAAHISHRSLENDIAVQMLTSNNVDVMLSGGLRHWIPANINHDKAAKAALRQQIKEPSIRLKSKRNDNQNLLTQAQQLGYELAFNRSGLAATKGEKVLGLFSYSGMNGGIVNTHTQDLPTRAQPSLREMTIKALDILSQDPDGFFLMIEGGQIDWAAHNNDAGSLLHELLKFDQAISAVYEWVKTRNDTLVLITADHETGSFGLSYSRMTLPDPQPLPGDAFQDTQFKPNFNFGQLTVLDKLYQQKKSLGDILALAKGNNKLPSPQSLMAAVNANSEFKINLQEATKALAREKNDLRVAGHSSLDVAEFPKVNDFKEFYVYGDDVHINLVARQLAKYQNIVWGTGTHTHTPVPVFAWGPKPVIEPFANMLHHAEVGQMAINILTGVDPQGN